MSSDLRDRGIAIANEAVTADNAGNYEEAVGKYCKAAEYLLGAIKFEKNPVTLKTLREKAIEYTTRAETLKKGTAAKPKASKGGGEPDEKDEDSDGGEDPLPLTEEQLAAAEKEMNEELSKLVGMASVKENMQKLCKQLSLDIKRRQGGLNTLDSIRHMMFTGNPGVGKTTVSRLVAKLYHQLGVSSKDTVVEVQKGDLVAGYVNQTAMKTAKKIKEARGGILFVDEAYQLTQALQRGQSDFSGESIDEMMKVMNDSGRRATTFVFAGYKKEMDEFVQYNAGLESRIKYKFHFDDYTVPELVTITNIKMNSTGYKMTHDASSSLEAIIGKGTTPEMRSKYNGRLVDNLLQWAADEMNSRLSLDASGDQLITLETTDFSAAIKRFATAKPPTKLDPALAGGKQVETQLATWGLQQYTELFVRAGYRQLFDLLALKSEKDIRALGVNKDADVRRAMTLVHRLDQQHRDMSLQMDAMYIDPETVDMKTWLEKRGLLEYLGNFETHKIDFEALGLLTYDDVREIGIEAVGPRRKVFSEITKWKEERDAKKNDVIRQRMAAQEELLAPRPQSADPQQQQILELRQQLLQMP